MVVEDIIQKQRHQLVLNTSPPDTEGKDKSRLAQTTEQREKLNPLPRLLGDQCHPEPKSLGLWAHDRYTVPATPQIAQLVPCDSEHDSTWSLSGLPFQTSGERCSGP